jgi:hypothetical protein
MSSSIFLHTLYEETKTVSEKKRKDILKPEITNGVILLINVVKDTENPRHVV